MTNIIAGPPGTGKTTALLRVVEGALNRGTAPEHICYVAFTRRAAYEARDRAMRLFNFDVERLCYFRTLHSLAFKALSLERDMMMGKNDYLNIAKMLGISISFHSPEEDGTIYGMEKGDRLFFAESLSRNRLEPLDVVWHDMINDDIDWGELEQLRDTLSEYKSIRGKMDFNDIIGRFLVDDIHIDMDLLIVDEAQDLSRLQWHMVDKLSDMTRTTYIAGDDDQSIFRWAGANTETFVELKGNVTILNQSYRVPKRVAELARTIVGRVSHRMEKRWNPTEVEGTIEYHILVEEIDMSTGTWLLLARNVYLLKEYVEHCTREGLIFESRTGSPIHGKTLQAMRDWETLRKDETLSVARIKNIYDHMSVRERVRYGYKGSLDVLDESQQLSLGDLRTNHGLLTNAVWHEALDKINDVEREYFLAALMRGENVLREPRIKINTIHGVKGAEADHVVIRVDMAQRTYMEYMENPDDEFRVWYVAVTRARESLHILQPTTQRYLSELW